MPDITQGELAAYLNALSSADVYNKYRSLLVVIYRHAVSEQAVMENLPEKIIKRDAEAKSRGRLTLDAYKAIFAKAPFAIQSAMELSLNSLQRRTTYKHGDLTSNRMAMLTSFRARPASTAPARTLRSRSPSPALPQTENARRSV